MKKKERSMRVLSRLVAKELSDEAIQSIAGGCEEGFTCTVDGPVDDDGRTAGMPASVFDSNPARAR